MVVKGPETSNVGWSTGVKGPKAATSVVRVWVEYGNEGT